MPFISPRIKPTGMENDIKYMTVSDILSAPDYYKVLGITKNASTEEIRRAYIKRSRICHPDKFVPPYPLATESFQILSIAYETLNNPSSKLIYDLSYNKQKSTSASGRHHCFSENTTENEEDYNPHQTLQRVLHQLFIEMLEGEFETMRAFIRALNETSPGMHITDDAIIQIEIGFRKMRELVMSTHQYYKAIQFELMKLYELQHELRSLSYFSLWKRMQLSITICKVLLQLPIIINDVFKHKSFASAAAAAEQEEQEEGLCDEDGSKEGKQYDRSSIFSMPSILEFAAESNGILNPKIEGALQMAVNLLEAGERYVKAW